MASVTSPARIFDEIADLIASEPDRETLLAYRPSQPALDRASELLQKNREGSLTADEQHELDQFTQAELFLRLVKARVRKRIREGHE